MQRNDIALNAFEKYIHRGFIMRPQLHHLVPRNLYDFSIVDGGSALILDFNGHSTQFEEISRLLLSNKARGSVIIAEDGISKFPY